MPDVLFTFAAIAWTMAVIFIVASFMDADVTAGDAGRVLARLFSAALIISGLLLFALGVGLLRDDRYRADHYLVPMLVGAIIGSLEALAFLWPNDTLLLFPFILVLFALRPVRRGLSRMFRGQGSHG